MSKCQLSVLAFKKAVKPPRAGGFWGSRVRLYKECYGHEQQSEDREYDRSDPLASDRTLGAAPTHSTA